MGGVESYRTKGCIFKFFAQFLISPQTKIIKISYFSQMTGLFTSQQ